MKVTVHPSSRNGYQVPRVYRNVRNSECNNGRVIMFLHAAENPELAIDCGDKIDVDTTDKAAA